MNRNWMLLTLMVATIGACDGESPTSVPNPEDLVATVTVGPSVGSLVVGDTLSLTALAKTATGYTLEGLDVAWSSQAAQFASVTASGNRGRVRALRAGTAVIQATIAGKSGQAEITISNPIPRVDAIAPASVGAGGPAFTLVLTGVGFVDGSLVTWNGNERPTTYVGPSELRAQVPATDIGAVGTANVRVVTPAPGGGVSNARTLTIGTTPPPPAGQVATVEISADSVVLEEGAETTLTATARDANGQVVTGRVVVWTSVDAEVAAVGALGKLTGIRSGSTAIRARVDGVTATVPVRVWTDPDYNLVFTGWDGTEPSTMRSYWVDLGDPTRTATRVGPDALSHSAVPSPDGSRVAYVLELGNGLRGIMVANADGSGAKQIDISADAWCGRFSWSPDGARVAFGCSIGDTDPDIWVADADGGNLVNITDTHPGKQEWPSWSPVLPGGGTRIAYAQFVNGEPAIWTMAPDGSDPRAVTFGMDRQPAWSPDGSTIAFQRTGAATFGDIFVVNATGGNERHLVGGYLAGPQEAPAWSPDGKMLAFSSTHETYGTDSVPQIFTVWSDGTKLARRTDGTLRATSPSWRPR